MSQLQFSDKQYLSRSWHMLTREKGWMKAIILLTLCGLIPIIGGLVVLGAAFEWARLTAWGVESSPKQKSIDFGKCLKTGFFAFIIMLIVQAILHIVMAVVIAIVPFLTILSFPVLLFGEVVAGVIALYATIYGRFSAAMSFSNLWKMISHDWKGLLKITGDQIILGLILSAIGFIWTVVIGILLLGTAAPGLAGDISRLASPYVSSGSEASIVLDIISRLITAFLPLVVLSWIAITFSSVFTLLLSYNMMGLWMLQFRVSEWTNPDDPLPTPLTSPNSGIGSTTPASPINPDAPASSATSANASYVPTPVAIPLPESTSPDTADSVTDTQTDAQVDATAAAEKTNEADASVDATANMQPEEPAPAEEPSKLDEPTETPAETATPIEETPVSNDSSVDAVAVKDDAVDDNTSVPTTDTTAFCPECGTKVPENSMFCPQCGSKLEG
ncbi:MAG: zinc-ribbon domain-containing protein [Atopobium sp.]|uniref:zinc-ribbon domain-containing protein n=1 Tax=Atopobium sp. TaxID=1872650 RepID=UPI002A83BFFD|nr:zinc-ribbon domain-containing protein [Atopobium sp.]MDY4522620.1 zinc-ribbon domain-containing protein [Atopobium sp.]